MNLTDVLRLAWLGLCRRPVRSGLTGLGIAVAVASMVLFLSLGAGLRQVFVRELTSVGPDLQLTRSGLAQGLLPSPDLSPDAATAVQKYATELGIVQVTPVAISLRQALDPAQSAVFYGLPPGQGIEALFSGVVVASGRGLVSGDLHRSVAVLGASAARNLGVKVGQQLRLNRRASATVVGILQPDSSLTDTFTFLPLEAAQRAFGVGDQLSLVAVRLRHPQDAARVASLLSKRLRLEATTRSDVLGFVGRLLSSSDAISLGLSVIALIVGGLAVINTVMMGVFERLPEFATLRAMGARVSLLRRLVMVESLLLSLLGAVAGLLLGSVGMLLVNVYTRQLANIDAAALTPSLVLLTLAISLLLGLLAGLFPARLAGRTSITAALARV